MQEKDSRMAPALVEAPQSRSSGAQLGAPSQQRAPTSFEACTVLELQKTRRPVAVADPEDMAFV